MNLIDKVLGCVFCRVEGGYYNRFDNVKFCKMSVFQENVFCRRVKITLNSGSLKSSVLIKKGQMLY